MLLSDKVQSFHQQQTREAVSVSSPKCFKKNVLPCEHTCGNVHKHTLKHTQTLKFQVSIRFSFSRKLLQVYLAFNTFVNQTREIKIRQDNEDDSTIIWVQPLKPDTLKIDPPLYSKFLKITCWTATRRDKVLNFERLKGRASTCFSFDLWQSREWSKGKTYPSVYKSSRGRYASYPVLGQRS